MIITKQQSKRLRYICGAVDYNQPCDRKYTGGPEGKIRQIGKFKYIERENELVCFEYDGNVTPLSNYEAEEFLSALADDSGFHLGGGIRVEDLPSEDTNGHNDIVDAIAAAVEHITVEVLPQNEVHKVDLPIEVQPASDGWMDDEGNDPDNLDEGTADIPERLSEEEKKAAVRRWCPPAINTSTEAPPVEMTAHTFTKEGAEKSIEDMEGQPLTGAPPAKTPKQMTPEELTEDVVREISMTAAAREAARLHQIEYYNMPDIPSENIIRANAQIPGFLDNYGKCLKKVGMARTLTEIAKALPGQIDWIFR